MWVKAVWEFNHLQGRSALTLGEHCDVCYSKVGQHCFTVRGWPEAFATSGIDDESPTLPGVNNFKKKSFGSAWKS